MSPPDQQTNEAPQVADSNAAQGSNTGIADDADTQIAQGAIEGALQPQPEPQAENTQAPEAAKQTAQVEPTRLVGFIAVSASRAPHIVAFAVHEGFDEQQPLADLRAQLVKDGDWFPFAVLAGGPHGIRFASMPSAVPGGDADSAG